MKPTVVKPEFEPQALADAIAAEANRLRPGASDEQNKKLAKFIKAKIEALREADKNVEQPLVPPPPVRRSDDADHDDTKAAKHDPTPTR